MSFLGEELRVGRAWRAGEEAEAFGRLRGADLISVDF